MSFTEKSSSVSIAVEKNGTYKPADEICSESNSDNLFWQKITFLMIGLCSLNVWNALLQMQFKQTEYYAFQLSGLVITSIINLFIPSPKYLLPYFMGGLIGSSVFLQLCHFLLSEETYIYGYAVAFTLIGVFAGIIQTTAFSLASSMKTNLSGFISGGFGISGIFTFILNVILDGVVSKKIRHTVNSDKMLYSYIICEIFIVVTIVMIIYNLPLKEKAPSTSDQESNVVEEEEKRNLSAYEILKDIQVPMIVIFIVNFLTTHLFPAVGPVIWADSHKIKGEDVTIIIGMYQIGDFLGRYLPNLSDYKIFKCLIFSNKYLLTFSILRFAFVAWFIVIAIFRNIIFGNLFTLCITMFLFALTNGWFITLSYINFVPCLRKNKTKKDIETAANYMVINMFVGLCIGIWSAIIYKFINF